MTRPDGKTSELLVEARPIAAPTECTHSSQLTGEQASC
jgi:hypothetical protein